MSERVLNLREDAMKELEKTSRTFFVPIKRLPGGLKEAVASAYLCLRAIDEIEDHPTLDRQKKQDLLHKISHALQCHSSNAGASWEMKELLLLIDDDLPDVTRNMWQWVRLAPESIAPRIEDATAAMAERMAGWVKCNWIVQTAVDLDHYTFSVAGAVGLLLSDLWAWFDGTQTNRQNAIGFGRGLQAVNILRNRKDDFARGVNFFPIGWTEHEMQDYARRNLQHGFAYVDSLPKGAIWEFCYTPLTLAVATLDALAAGRQKLSRSEVVQIFSNIET